MFFQSPGAHIHHISKRLDQEKLQIKTPFIMQQKENYEQKEICVQKSEKLQFQDGNSLKTIPSKSPSICYCSKPIKNFIWSAVVKVRRCKGKGKLQKSFINTFQYSISKKKLSLDLRILWCRLSKRITISSSHAYMHIYLAIRGQWKSGNLQTKELRKILKNIN